MKRPRKKKKGPNSASNVRSGPFFPKVQTKLSIGKADDVYEKEADSVADKVVNQSGEGAAIEKKSGESSQIQEKPIDSITPIQKKEGAEEEKEPAVQKQEEQEEQPVQKQEEEEKPVQKQEEEEQPVQKQEEEEQSVQKQEEEEEPIQAKSNSTVGNGGSVESKLKSTSGQGEKMSKSTQREMEAGFGTNFNDVSIHTGSEAEAMSKELGAQAFTSGKDVYFNEGKYDPNSKEGKHLLAHELTHTIQQKGSELKTRKQNK